MMGDSLGGGQKANSNKCSPSTNKHWDVLDRQVGFYLWGVPLEILNKAGRECTCIEMRLT